MRRVESLACPSAEVEQQAPANTVAQILLLRGRKNHRQWRGDVSRRPGLELSRTRSWDKVQSDGDLFKGVVSKILSDVKMPLVRLAGKLVRAEVVCEMGASAEKHGSLRFAHGQMALYALATIVGARGELTLEDIADLTVKGGVYGSEDIR